METGRKLSVLAVFMLLSFLPAARLLADDPAVPGIYRCVKGWTGTVTLEGESIQRIKSQGHSYHSVSKWEFELKDYDAPLGPKGHLKDYLRSYSKDVYADGSHFTRIQERDFDEQVSPDRGPSEIQICRMQDGELMVLVAGPSVRLMTKETINGSVSYPDDLNSEQPIFQLLPIKLLGPPSLTLNPLVGSISLIDTVAGDAKSDWFVSTQLVCSWNLEGPGLPPMPPGIIPVIPPRPTEPPWTERIGKWWNGLHWDALAAQQKNDQKWLSLCSATATLAAIKYPNKPMLVIGAVCGVFSALSGVVADYADPKPGASLPPPAPDFQDHENPHRFTLPKLPPYPGVDAAALTTFNALSANQADIATYIDALGKSIGRARGAAAAGSRDWERTQLQAAAEYADRLAQLLTVNNELRQQAATALRAMGALASPIDRAEWEAVQQQVSLTGLPKALVDVLTTAGMDADAIDELEFQIIITPYTESVTALSILVDPAVLQSQQEMAATFRELAKSAAAGP